MTNKPMLSKVERVVIDGVEYVRAFEFDRLNSYFHEDMHVAPRLDKWTITGDRSGDYVFKDCAITIGKDISVTSHMEVAILALMMELKRKIDALRDKDAAERLKGIFMSGAEIRGADAPLLPPFQMDHLAGSMLKGAR